VIRDEVVETVNGNCKALYRFLIINYRVQQNFHKSKQSKVPSLLGRLGRELRWDEFTTRT
jgi:hypothetical protein